jgi:hypothetical protein
MKSFKEHLLESKKKYDFRVKVAGEFTTEQETKLKSLMDRYTVDKFKKVGKTPIQELPLDFPQVKNCEVTIYEVTVDYPTTQHELTEYLSSELGLNKQRLAVRRPGEPSEQYQAPIEERKDALLTDPDYKEAPNANFDDYYGSKYNSGFVKELNDLLKLQRNERGEKIPSEGGGEFKLETAIKDTDAKSVLKQAEDPRRK